MRQSIRMDILSAIIVIVIGSACVSALILTECNNVEDEQFIVNPRNQCVHGLIYCSGEDSQFCDSQVLCDPSYNCDAIIENTTATSGTSAWSTISSSTSSSTSTSIKTTDIPITTTTSETVDVRALCHHGVTQKYKYPGNCNYYYYCMDGFLIVEQCPIGYAFYEPNGTCSGRIADIPDCKQKRKRTSLF